MGTVFPLFQSPGILPDCYEFSSIMESGLATPAANSLRALGCICGSYRLKYIQISQVITHLIFYLQWEGLCSSTHHRAVHPLKMCGKRVCHWRLKQKSYWVPLPPYLLLPVFQHCYQGLTPLTFLVNGPVEALHFALCLPWQVQFRLHLGHLYTTELYTLPGDPP